MAGKGFKATSADLSEYGINHLKEWAAREKLIVETRICNMLDLPFPDNTFDCIMAYNVVEPERELYGHFYYRIPNGESCADVFDRVSDFMGTLWRDFKKPTFPNNVVIVTHGMTLRLFVMRFLHSTVEEFETWANPKNGEVFELKLDNTYEENVRYKQFRDNGGPSRWKVLGDSKYKLVTPFRERKLTHNWQFDWKLYED